MREGQTRAICLSCYETLFPKGHLGLSLMTWKNDSSYIGTCRVCGRSDLLNKVWFDNQQEEKNEEINNEIIEQFKKYCEIITRKEINPLEFDLLRTKIITSMQYFCSLKINECNETGIEMKILADDKNE